LFQYPNTCQANLQGNMIPEETKNAIMLDHAGTAAKKIMGKVGD
jgi:hypothetical protein